MGERVAVDEHARFVRSLLASLGARPTERVPLDDALGRITASPVESPIPLPPFRNAQMDGFAVRAADVAGASAESSVALPVVGELAAAPGTPEPLIAGTAVRIMTGAPVPDGADAVVPVEDTESARDGATVRIRRSRAAGEYVREAGSDLAAGADVLPAGIRLEPRHLAAAAASGLAELLVRERVRVAVVSTGSELVAPGERLAPGEIPDANGVALVAAVRAAGAVVRHTARVRDDVERLRVELDAAVDAGAELILTSGGISQGAYEVVRELIEPLGAWVGSVAMQPGGPQATGVYRGVPLIGFPGNPVSTQLSFALFVAPSLRAIAGLPPPRSERLPLAEAITSIPGRRQILRGRRTPDGTAAPVGGPGSHLVAALAASDLLIVVPEYVTSLDAGDLVDTVDL
ncbi:molybdopterin molybdotransferase [Agromyces flavus]|uniref:Molybdopterin molybdenumtransferase n=1 Tax=Agromyces flavus TaxID=589382 RepID=A0A1H1ZR91_9MICO|nr:gephyrin-like molybdotransferase Glp [Agromyces flavus]MCP2367224.1 molybdopterin molybdotransferase [Agromyces flavus]GGI46155.1 molybdopterin molybdenumtransferase [Agromyces flavus]SDT36214.1 molybdopterin molybdochelatase [Agromyces flavus]